MLNKDLAWFNNKSNDSYSGKSITENQYKIGKIIYFKNVCIKITEFLNW